MQMTNRLKVVMRVGGVRERLVVKSGHEWRFLYLFLSKTIADQFKRFEPSLTAFAEGEGFVGRFVNFRFVDKSGETCSVSHRIFILHPFQVYHHHFSSTTATSPPFLQAIILTVPYSSSMNASLLPHTTVVRFDSTWQGFYRNWQVGWVWKKLLE